MVPFGFRRRLRSGMLRRRWVLGIVTTAVVAALAFFVGSALGVNPGVLSGSPSNFESGDGNMVANFPNDSDWNCVADSGTLTNCGPGFGQTGSGATLSGPSPNYVSLPDATTGDLHWKPGQKQDTNCPTLEPGGAPDKDSFTNVASYNETAFTNNTLGDTFLYGATIRVAANGNASENVELNQNGGTASCSIPRTVGDRLIAIDYTGGGTSVAFNVLTWVNSPNSFTDSNGVTYSGTCLVANHTGTAAAPAGCWSMTVTPIASSAANGMANQSTIAAADNGITGQQLLAGFFAEFGVNLTAAGIIPAGSCQGFAQAVWESRSSGSSFNSNPEDIEIEKHPINNCGHIKVIKQTKPRGIDQSFGFTSTLPSDASAGGVACASPSASDITADLTTPDPDNDADNSGVQSATNGGVKGSFCLNDVGNTGTANSTGNTVSEDNVSPGQYTITENTEPGGFGFGGVSCSGSTTTPTNPTTQGVTVTLGINGTVVCTFTNNQQLGAIKITKESIKTGNPVVGGAHFEVCTNSGLPCTAVANGSDLVTGATTGTACVDHLSFSGTGTTYYVRETQPPTGFSQDTTDTPNPQAVTVSANSTCGDGNEAAFTFKDTPLSQITVSFKALGTNADSTPGTTSDIVACASGTTPPTTDTGVGSGLAPNSTTGDTTTANRSKTFGNGTTTLTPGTYTCTVHIDP